MAIVIIREDLIREDVLAGTPTMLTYKIHADAGSLYNTPPAYSIYMCGKVFRWLKRQGGETMIFIHDYRFSSSNFLINATSASTPATGMAL